MPGLLGLLVGPGALGWREGKRGPGVTVWRRGLLAAGWGGRGVRLGAEPLPRTLHPEGFLVLAPGASQGGDVPLGDW